MLRLLRRPDVCALFLIAAAVLGVTELRAAPPPKELDILIEYNSAPGDLDEEHVKQSGGKVKHKFRLVHAHAARVPENAIAGLRNNKKIKLIEQDVKIYTNDTELDSTWGVLKINAGAVHSSGATGAGVKVAVIDTGIDYLHADLDGNYRGGYDFVNNDNDPMDDNGHGTHVAGTIAAEDNDVGVVGVAPKAELYALKVLDSTGSGSFSAVIAAIEWCIDNNIQVTNNSYGTPSDPGTIVRQAFEKAAVRGIVMVAASGNSGTSDGSGDNVNFPGRFDTVIAVGATTSADLRASFSSTGPAVDVAAPGASINSTIRGGGYGYKSGTSMASPHVAGAAAVLIGIGASATTVRQALTSTAIDLGTGGVDAWYGSGRIDVAQALASARTQPPDSDPTPDPDPPTTLIARVASISYSMNGGKASNKNVIVTIRILDQNGAPVPNANVAVRISRGSTLVASTKGTTTTNGIVTFNVNNAKSGTYSTLVTGVTAADYVWDGVSPVNSYAKK